MDGGNIGYHTYPKLRTKGRTDESIVAKFGLFAKYTFAISKGTHININCSKSIYI